MLIIALDKIIWKNKWEWRYEYFNE